MNNYINENRKTSELIKDEIFKLYEKVNKQFDDLKINNINNNINNQEIKYNNGSRIKYIGQVLNGVPEGKGIMYWDNGDRYEGEWKNEKKMEKELIIIAMVKDMKVIGSMVKGKEKELIIGKMVKNMKGNGNMIKEKEKELCI